MKAILNDMTIEGTPEEVVEFLNLTNILKKSTSIKSSSDDISKGEYLASPTTGGGL